MCDFLHLTVVSPACKPERIRTTPRGSAKSVSGLGVVRDFRCVGAGTARSSGDDGGVQTNYCLGSSRRCVISPHSCLVVPAPDRDVRHCRSPPATGAGAITGWTLCWPWPRWEYWPAAAPCWRSGSTPTTLNPKNWPNSASARTDRCRRQSTIGHTLAGHGRRRSGRAYRLVDAHPHRHHKRAPRDRGPAGKTMRGAKNGSGDAGGGGVPHLLAALDQEAGAVLAQQRLEDKTSQIPALKQLLARHDLTGAVITADAQRSPRPAQPNGYATGAPTTC